MEQTQRLWTKHFIILTLSYFLLFFNLQMLLPTLPSYVKQRFDANDVTVSLVTSLFALSAIITRFAVAAVVEKWGRFLLLLGLIMTASCTALYFSASSVMQIYLLRIVYGIGFGMGSTVIPTIVAKIIPGNRMGVGIGYFGLSTVLAMSLGPTVGFAIYQTFSFEALCVFATPVIIVIMPLIFMRTLFTSHISNLPVPDSDEPIRQVTGRGDLFGPALLNMLFAVTYGGILSFLALYGKELLITQVGFFFLTNALSVLIVRPLSGKIFDRRGHAPVLVPGALLVMISLFFLSYITVFWQLMLAGLVYGLGFGMIQPSIQAWMLKDTTPQRRGMANALFYSSTDMGIAVGSMLLGYIASVTSYSTMYRISSLFLVLFLAGYVCILRKTTKNDA